MRNSVLIFLCCVMMFSCAKRTQLNEVTQGEDANTTSRVNEKDTDTLFAVINKYYQPKYLEENKYQLIAKGDKMKSFTKEGMGIHFDILGIVSESEVATDSDLGVIHTRLQNTLQTATSLPDYQRLVAGTATRFMGRRLLRNASNTLKEKELILFYTRSFVEQQGTNYYLVYTALKSLKGYTTVEDIKGLAQKVLGINSQLDVSTYIAKTKKQERIWYEKIAEGERYNQIYRIKLQEFL